MSLSLQFSSYRKQHLRVFVFCEKLSNYLGSKSREHLVNCVTRLPSDDLSVFDAVGNHIENRIDAGFDTAVTDIAIRNPRVEQLVTNAFFLKDQSF